MEPGKFYDEREVQEEKKIRISGEDVGELEFQAEVMLSKINKDYPKNEAWNGWRYYY